MTVLIAPLDWGLGHATRCIPIIYYLTEMNCKVIIACEGAQENLLKKEFPQLKYLPLQGYRIKYSKNKRFFPLKIFCQLPKIYKAINYERKWLEAFVQHNKVDLVISDNRYGFYHPNIPSVFITHQLLIKAPFAFAEKIIQRINYSLIKRFKECWVPDEAGQPNIAGLLSHPNKPPTIPVRYLGGISRFKNGTVAGVDYKVLIVLSGPEPQRSILEEKLIEQLKVLTGRVLLVRGLPGSSNAPAIPNVEVVNHLTAAELGLAFQRSEYVISRSGYTTVMDICKLRSKAILVPTPGQTEQEYLAKHLEKQGWCMYFQQNAFLLREAITAAENFDFRLPDLRMDSYRKVILEFIQGLPPSTF